MPTKRKEVQDRRTGQMHRKNLGYNYILRVDQLTLSRKKKASVEITDTIICMERRPETFCNFMRRGYEGEAMQLQLHQQLELKLQQQQQLLLLLLLLLLLTFAPVSSPLIPTVIPLVVLRFSRDFSRTQSRNSSCTSSRNFSRNSSRNFSP